jgi:NADH-quinone oxidoreductase subunit L
MTLLLVVAMPLATSLVITFLGRRLGRRSAGAVLSFGLALAFGAALAIAQAFAAGRTSLDAPIGPWLPLRGADLQLVVSPPIVPLLVTLSAVSALIALAGIGAPADDEGASRFAGALALCTGALLLVVIASDLLLLFAGWELLAVGTYLLVAHRHDRPADAAAGVKASVIARIGDTALLVAILSLFATYRTTDIVEIFQRSGGQPSAPHGTAALAPSLLVVVGALARSAQVPLHVWLPDVTRAPATGSALLQSAVVASGVVVLLRLAPILHPDALASAAAIGAVTALAAAIVALAQRERRALLAWSTISQVGLMFVAAGTGAAFAAAFLLITHAAAKAALTLCGEARGSRVAAFAIASGTLALTAVPPAAGYFSAAALAASLVDRPLLLAAVLAAIPLTGLYAARIPSLSRATGADASASPLGLVPVIVLAVIALSVGGLVATGAVSLGTPAPDVSAVAGLACAALAFAGLVAGLALRARPLGLPRRWVEYARSGFGLDALYRMSLVAAFNGAARILDAGTERLLEEAADRVGRLVVRVAALVNGAHGRYARASEVVVLAAAVGLVLYWTVR